MSDRSAVIARVTPTYASVVRYRRAVLQAMLGALFLAAMWAWLATRPASFGSFLVAAAILFPFLCGLRLIIDAGGVLLADERARNRRAEIDKPLW